MKTECCDCCHPEVIDSKACGCCEGLESLTPMPTANRPGLSQLSYRIGSHSSFLESMMARLSSSDYPELAGLTTRNADDLSIALLDSWATVADVLTFYQERIANEGYLRSATERRSILELARLVGYKLRPGVSSSVFLAYTIDANTKGETTIPQGSRAQSVPGPDELPQSFETSEDLKARAKWNNLKPRISQPQTLATLESNPHAPRVYLKGINSMLKPNDPLLIGVATETPDFYRVKEVVPDADTDRTLVTLQASEPAPPTPGKEYSTVKLIKDLTLSPSRHPAGSLRLKRTLNEQFKKKGESGYRTLSTFAPSLRETMATAVENAQVAPEFDLKVYTLRHSASLFGHNHPGSPNYQPAPNTDMIQVANYTPPDLRTTWPSAIIGSAETTGGLKNIALDPPSEEIAPGTWITVIRPNLNVDAQSQDWTESVHQVTTAKQITLSAFGVSSKVSLLGTDASWLSAQELRTSLSSEALLRDTTVYVQSEELILAEEPIDKAVCGGTEELLEIELDGFYEGLESGRWVIVSGEREIDNTSGVRFSELAMLASVSQNVAEMAKDNAMPGDKRPREGEKNHTFIKLAEPLQYCFKRDTVSIYGNVVKATHGETRREVLGSGDGSKALQSFDLKQSPLTQVSASNPTGVDSTLSLFVNDIKWRESDSLAGRNATDRLFVTTTDDDARTSIIFGNGREGARLPTGIENIRAVYRNGIGKGGNVNAEQISLLATKPLGVKEVINPLRASGGADRENRDQARKSAPLAVKALDRLVSVVDYQDFARLYAGIGKSHAVELSNGRRQLVHVTIAGADDIPIDERSDLFINLRQALHDFGDPYQPIQLAVRELMFVVISAKIQIKSEYLWEPVAEKVRAALLDTFSFERRELGQDLVLSQVISVIQAVPGVNYVDVDTFGGIPEKRADKLEPGKRRLLIPDEITAVVQGLIDETEEQKRPGSRLKVNRADFEQGSIRPAQLAFLSPDVPDTLILNQIK